jgi:hypothetical protein
MATEARKSAVSKFPLRLMPSVHQTAKLYSEKEGVSLNQFINVAVAEKLAHMQHEEWVRNRKEITPERTAWALDLLERSSKNPLEPGDELPDGYRRKK